MQKRILYVLYTLKCGGIQEWLISLLYNIDLSKYHIDILIFENFPSPYLQQLENLGIKVIICDSHRNITTFPYKLFRILKNYGPYDIFHAHTHYHSGIDLMVAKIAGIKNRISHIHNNLQELPGVSLLYIIYHKLMKYMIGRTATYMIAVSNSAGESCFGKNWLQDKRSSIIYCGLDFKNFTKPITHNIKQALGLPENALVIGHVGRFATQKNHKFILEIFKEIYDQNKNIYLLLIGEGELYNNIITYAETLRISDKIIFAGERNDVPDILRQVVDLFLFPSLYEGLGLAIVEALAAGKPCVISNHLPQDSHLIPELIHPLSIHEPTKIWANKIINLLNQGSSLSQETAYKTVANSSFTIEKSVHKITALYDKI